MRFLVLLLIALGGPATAQVASSPRAGRAEALLDVEQLRLPNGLTVVLAHDSTTPYVAVESWYAAGTRDDPQGKRGRAHLFEHAFTARRIFANPANAPLSLRFVNSNAQVRRDHTRYYSEVRGEDLRVALALHADRMDTPDSLITDALIARHVNVVVNEGRQERVNAVEDGPSSFSLRQRNAFPPWHPYALQGETEASLRAITTDDLRAWRSERYGPEHAVLLVVGRFDRRDAHAEIARLFGGIPSRTLPGAVRERGTAVPTPARRERITGQVSQPQLWARWATPWFGHPDADLLQLAAIILARPSSGPIAAPLVRDGSLAVGPLWQAELSELAGHVEVSLIARDERALAAAAAALHAAVATLSARGPAAADLAWAKQQWELWFLGQLETLGFQRSRAEVLGEGALFAGDAEAYRDRLARIRAATPGAIAQAVRRWMLGAGYLLELVPRPTLTTTATPVDHAATISMGLMAPARAPVVRETELGRGRAVVVAPRPGYPLVRVSLIVPAGSDARSAAMNDLVSRLLARRLEALAPGQVARSASADELVVSVTGLPRHAEAIIGAFGGLPAGAPTDGWRAERDAIAARLTVPDNEMARRLAFGAGHPAVVADSAAVAARLASLDDAGATRLVTEALARPGVHVAVSGGVAEGDAAAMIRRALASWPAAAGSHAEAARHAEARPVTPGIYVRNAPGRSQVRVAAVLPLPAGASPAVEALLERDLQARVNQRLRIERQWSYGAASTTIGAAGARATVVWAEVQPDRAADAILEVEKVLAEYRDDRAARDTASIAESLRQSLVRRGQTLGGLEGVMRESLAVEGSAGSVRGRFDRLGSLGAADIAAARAAADPTNVRFLITGDAGALIEQLEKAGRKAAPQPA